MALFGSKEKKTEGEKVVIVKKAALTRPRFTEKATLATDNSVYTFVVAKNATKESIRAHVIEKFGKTPTKIRISILPSKKRRKGEKPEVKKAYVYLPKGEKIDFV